MEITQITKFETTEYEKNRGMLAEFDITFENKFMVHKIKLLDKGRGYFISFPSYKNLSGEWKPYCRPINKSFNDYIRNTLVKFYEGSLNAGN